MNSTSNAGFGPVLAVRALLSDLTVPYWIAGGWAIDLAVGRVTRDHADVDIMLLERDEHALRTDLTQVDVQLIGRGGQPGPWPAGRRLLAGPHPGPSSPPTASSCTARTSRCPPRCSWPARSEPSGSTTGARTASGDHSPASPATSMASRSWLPRWRCCSSRARTATRTGMTSKPPCRSSTPSSAHGSKTPWNTCHTGKRHLCPADEINRRHATAPASPARH
jgi:hypothetical protein